MKNVWKPLRRWILSLIELACLVINAASASEFVESIPSPSAWLISYQSSSRWSPLRTRVNIEPCGSWKTDRPAALRNGNHRQLRSIPLVSYGSRGLISKRKKSNAKPSPAPVTGSSTKTINPPACMVSTKRSGSWKVIS